MGIDGRPARYAATATAAKVARGSDAAAPASPQADAERNEEQQYKEITVGVLALQGAFANHIDAFKRLGKGMRLNEVRRPAELQHVDALVIPGGESTSMRIIGGKEMIEAIRGFVHQQRKPVWGTCAGCILLADSVLSVVPECEAAERNGERQEKQHRSAAEPAADSQRPQEPQLNSSNGVLRKSCDGYGGFIGGAHVQVCRNFFGRQVDSFEAPLRCVGRLQGVAEGMVGICIRAPAILKVLSPKVEILGYLDHPTAAGGSSGLIAAVAQANLLLTTFHPELTEDTRLHEFFVKHFIQPDRLSSSSFPAASSS